VADPPLAQVVSHSYQAGVRGSVDLMDGKLDWSVSLFRTDSDNDIVAWPAPLPAAAISPMCLPPSARASTCRPVMQHRLVGLCQLFLSGCDLPIHGTWRPPTIRRQCQRQCDRDTRTAHSAQSRQHRAGRRRYGGDGRHRPGRRAGFTGSQYFDGDPSNLNAKLPSDGGGQLRAAGRSIADWQFFGVVDNLFDNRDALYGSYFDPSGSAGLVYPSPDRSPHFDPASTGVIQLGIKLKF
jgi:iron complex outermembrane receptor protein